MDADRKESLVALISALERLQESHGKRCVGIWDDDDRFQAYVTGPLEEEVGILQSFSMDTLREGKDSICGLKEHPFIQQFHSSDIATAVLTAPKSAILIDRGLFEATTRAPVLYDLLRAYLRSKVLRAIILIGEAKNIVSSNKQWGFYGAPKVNAHLKQIAATIDTIHRCADRFPQSLQSKADGSRIEVRLPHRIQIDQEDSERALLRARMVLLEQGKHSEQLVALADHLRPTLRTECGFSVESVRVLTRAVIDQIVNAPGLAGISVEELFKQPLDLQGRTMSFGHPLIELDRHRLFLTKQERPSTNQPTVMGDFRL